MYKRILVPIDGSPTSNLGLLEALRLAKSQKARLLLLHIVEEYYALAGAESGRVAGDIMDLMRRSGLRIVAKALALASRGKVRAQTAVIESASGGAADLIVRHARKWRADLIVIGTHGRRGIHRVVLGSDAEQVVRTAPVPVLLVRAKP